MRSYHNSSIDRRSEGLEISYLFRGRMDFSRLITSIMTSLGAFMAWFPKEVNLFWIHISFVYANIYLSFYFEGPHSNFRYILVALKKDGNNVHFFDVLPHCAPPIKNLTVICLGNTQSCRTTWRIWTNVWRCKRWEKSNYSTKVGIQTLLNW